MEKLNPNRLAYRVLRTFYKMAPFDPQGALKSEGKVFTKDFVSCLVISNKIHLLKNLLEDLAQQDFPSERFEIVIVFDGTGMEAAEMMGGYRKRFNICFYQTPQPVRLLSDLRNISVALSQGEYLLFLDDDTRIFQKDFLRQGLLLLKESKADAVIPQAHALYGVVKARYDFLDRFSLTNRCCFYRHDCIEKIGGFLDGLHTYEDTELSIRLMLASPKVIYGTELNYYHPPLYFDSMQKPLAIGQTIFQLRRKYSFLFWLLVYMNSLRFLPWGLIPGQRLRQWFTISWGVWCWPWTRQSYYY